MANSQYPWDRIQLQGDEMKPTSDGEHQVPSNMNILGGISPFPPRVNLLSVEATCAPSIQNQPGILLIVLLSHKLHCPSSFFSSSQKHAVCRICIYQALTNFRHRTIAYRFELLRVTYFGTDRHPSNCPPIYSYPQPRSWARFKKPTNINSGVVLSRSLQ